MATQSKIYAQEVIKTEENTFKAGDVVTTIDNVTLTQLVQLASLGKLGDEAPSKAPTVVEKHKTVVPTEKTATK